MTPEEELYFQQLQTEVQKTQNTNTQLQQGMATMFGKQDDINLVQWQLDPAQEMERIEHLLRKHVPKRDESGNDYYDNPTEENQLFNEYGVQEILNVLAWYLNKNILLSRFDEEEIDIRLRQFAETLTDFIFINYEKFGLDNSEKIKHYPMVITNIVNTVEAAYHRALHGGERNSLRTARTVHQTENPMGFGMQQPSANPNGQKRFNILKPTTWIK